MESAEASNNQHVDKENMVYIDTMKYYSERKMKLCHFQELCGTGDEDIYT
jgi:hypothetical protein